MNKVKLLVVLFSVVLLMQIFLVSVTMGVGDSWVIKASMPTGRVNCKSVAATNGMIYAIGGTDMGDIATWTPSAVVGVNEMYNPDTDTWTTKKFMPTTRKDFGLTAYQNKIYAIGGRVNMMSTNTTGANEVYDITTDTWETKAPLPSTRDYIDANAVNGKIYVIGGRQVTRTGYTYFNDTLVYNIATNVWYKKTPPPIDIGKYASAVMDNKIYILPYESGNSLPYESCSLLIYDTDADEWSQGKSMPTSVRSAVMGATTGEIAPKRLYVIDEDLDVMQIYDPATDKWSTGTQIPTKRLAASIAVVNDRIYVIGGTGPCVYGHPSVANEMYIPANVMYTPTTENELEHNETNSAITCLIAIVVTVVIVAATIIVLKTKKDVKWVQRSSTPKFWQCPNMR